MPQLPTHAVDDVVGIGSDQLTQPAVVACRADGAQCSLGGGRHGRGRIDCDPRPRSATCARQAEHQLFHLWLATGSTAQHRSPSRSRVGRSMVRSRPPVAAKRCPIERATAPTASSSTRTNMTFSPSTCEATCGGTHEVAQLRIHRRQRAARVYHGGWSIVRGFPCPGLGTLTDLTRRCCCRRLPDGF